MNEQELSRRIEEAIYLSNKRIDTLYSLVTDRMSDGELKRIEEAIDAQPSLLARMVAALNREYVNGKPTSL